MAQDKKLSPVTYTRSFKAERELPALLVGGTRWIKDLELLLEDEWPKLLASEFGASVPDAIANSGAQLVVVEASQDVEQSRLCLESHVPSTIKKVLLMREGDNPFLKRTYINYGARCGVSVVELPDDLQQATKELSGFLSNFLSGVRTELEEDIDRAELLVEGFNIRKDIIALQFVRWSQRCEQVLAWLFPLVTLSTTEYRLLRLFSRAQPLLARREDWPDTVGETLLPLEAFCASTRAKEFLPLVVSLVSAIPSNGVPSKEHLLQAINSSQVGLLTKRALNKSADSLVLSTPQTTGVRKTG